MFSHSYSHESHSDVMHRGRLYALLLATSITTAPVSALTLPEAEQRALSTDAGVQVLQAQSRAFAEQAVAADSWMDPTLAIGTMNLPGSDIDPFNQGMFELTLEQMLPRGESSNIQRRKTGLQGEASGAAAANRQLSVLRDVRLAWIERWYWQQSLQRLKDDRSLFESLVSVIESMYRQGRKSQQDLLRSEVELSRLEARIISFQAGLSQSQAQLARWLGQSDTHANTSGATSSQPVINDPQPRIDNQKLLQHPRIQAADLIIRQSEQDVALAKEGYKPQWGIAFRYGREQGEMSTMSAPDSRNKLSAMVMMDIPLFTTNRQDRQLSASHYRHQASNAQRLDILRQLQGQLQTESARYEGLQLRSSLFRTQLMPQVVSQSEAALTAYQVDAGNFVDVIQAYKTRLDITLEDTRLQADTLQSKTKLLYLLPSRQDLQMIAQQPIQGKTK